MGDLSALSRLLVSGGDDRIRLLPATGANKYGVRPQPRDGWIEFSSSTASHLPHDAWQAVAGFEARIRQALQADDMVAICRREALRIRDAFFAIWGLPAGETLWHLHRSGTDAHAMACAMALARFGRPFRIVTGAASETGSQVVHALAMGSLQDGRPMADVTEITIRRPDGTCRSARAIDQDFYRAVTMSLADGVPVLVIRVDESKSGCIYPGREMLKMLSTASSDVAVLVDCSQFRCDAARFREYIADDFLIAVTGSKFFGAPAFCGALLASCAWRETWTGDDAGLDAADQSNPGLLARWEAALFTMERYRAIPEATRKVLAAQFSAALDAAIGRAGAGPVGEVDLVDALREDERTSRSLFALRAGRTDPRRSLLPEEVDRLYRRLHGMLEGVGSGCGYAFGQPMPGGSEHGAPTRYLRLSLSAPMMIDLARMTGEDAATWLRVHVSSAIEALRAEIERLP